MVNVAFLHDGGQGLFHRLIYLACSIPLPGQTSLDMIGDKLRGSNDEQLSLSQLDITVDL